MMKKFTLLFLIVILLGSLNPSYSQYCTCGAYTPYYMGISNVQLNTLNNSSSATYNNGYQNFTYLSPTTLRSGTTYSFSIDLYQYPQHVGIWIDFNHNSSFYDAGENIYMTSSMLNSGVNTFNVTIPAGLTITGNTTMRIRTEYGYYSLSDPCNYVQYGEAEDYTVNITLPNPIDMDVTSLLPEVAKLGNNTVKMTLKNEGLNTQPSGKTISLKYNVNGGTWVTEICTLSAPLPNGSSVTYTFTTPWNVSVNQAYTLCGKIEPIVTGDPDATDQICQSVPVGMEGTYYIDYTGAGDFVKFGDAVNAMNTRKVAGKCTFIVRPGTYTERVYIPFILGTSAVNNVTFKGLDRTNCKLTWSSGGAGSSGNSTLVLYGADYFTFDNLTIENTNSQNGVAIWFTNKADNNKIINCDIPVTENTSSYSCNILGNTNEAQVYNSGSSGNNGMNNLVDNCLISGGGYYGGIVWYGAGQGINANNTFSHNTLTKQYYYGMNFYYCGGNKVSFNSIKNFRYNYAMALYCYYGAGDTIISNDINPGYYGIYYYSTGNSASPTTLIANNMIYNFLHPNYQVGVNLNNAWNMKVVNNNIWVNGTYNYYYYPAFYAYYLYNAEVKNNIFVNTGSSYLFSVMYPQNGFNCDYNVYYTNYNGYSFCADYNYIYDFISFQNYTSYYLGSHDANSRADDPGLVSSSDLHLASGNKGFKGANVGLMYDYDNDMRCRIGGYIGADEPYHPNPTIGFIAADTVCLITPVTFYNLGLKDEPYVVTWAVNNILKASTFDFVYSFPKQKWDTVRMVYESCLSVDTVSKKLYANAPTAKPKVEFMASKNVAETGDPITLSDLSQNCPNKWQWDIYPDSMFDPDLGSMEPAYIWESATNDTFQSPVISFKYPGVYNVCLKNENSLGKGTNVCKNSYINIKLAQNMCGISKESVELFGSLYDDGGKGNYATNGTCTYVIKPCKDEVSVIFKEFNLSPGSYLKVYDGVDSKGIQLWDSAYGSSGISGSMSNPLFKTTLTAKKSGMIYIEFIKGSSTGPGFKLEWESKGTKTLAKPIASFTGEDTSCVVYPIYFKNTSITDYQFTQFRWDFDGNGMIDATTTDGVFNTQFMGISATFNTTLYAENCGGIDTFLKQTIIINPTSNPKGDFKADVTKPLVAQDIVTFSNDFERLSCVNTWDWTITPSNWFFVNTTGRHSANPQVIFADTGCYSVTLKMGNQNTSYTTTKSKTCYIKPLTYCVPVVTNKHQDIGISRVRIGTIDNKSAIGVASYTSYTNVTSTNIINGQKTGITIDRSTSFNPISIYVWIDYNGNGSFTDPGELVIKHDRSTGMSFTDSFLVPTSAKLGGTTLRIGINYAGYKNTPCGPNLYGEFEDYRVFILPDNVAPVITMLGASPVEVEVGYPYTDMGATAWDNLQGNLTSKIVTTSDVDTTKVGTYTVEYNVCDSLNNCAEEVERTVNITIDKTPPVLTLFGSTIIYININYPFVDPGYKAYDRASGDLTSKVVVTGNLDIYKLGTYNLTYSVTDDAGFKVTAGRTVIVVDAAPPTISLIGPSPLYLEIGQPYTEPGTVYTDNYWPSSRITYQISGYVDTTRIGTYTKFYSVTDASGNGPTTIYRQIIVWDSTAPVIKISGTDVYMLEVNNSFFDPGVVINDNSKTGFTVMRSGSFYENFPSGIPDSIGLFPIFYQVKDEAGNLSNFVARVIQVVDVRAPQITLNGDPYTAIEKWTTYVDPGYTITDNYYPVDDLIIDTFNNVDIHNLGIYQVKYWAKDPSGNESPEIVRLVKVIQTSTGINDDTQPSLGIYPNPSSGKFILSLNLPNTTKARISVLNQLGEEISIIKDGNLNSAEYSVDLSQFPSGVYTVKVQTENASLLKRVIINR